MQATLPNTDIKYRRVIALVGASLLATLIFLLIPITQQLQSPAPATIDVRKVVTIVPPTTPPPPPSSQPKPQKTPPPKPKFQQQTQQLQIDPLDLVLTPSIGEALAIGITSGNFQTETDTLGDLQQIFTFQDLAQAPRITNRPSIQFPRELTRQGITQGRVVALIEINEKGRATVLEIISSTHPQLIKVARNAIRQARFTPPTVDGIPQTVRGEWPLSLSAPK